MIFHGNLSVTALLHKYLRSLMVLAVAPLVFIWEDLHGPVVLTDTRMTPAPSYAHLSKIPLSLLDEQNFAEQNRKPVGTTSQRKEKASCSNLFILHFF